MRKAVTPRAILIGLAFVIIASALTPFNDFYRQQTYFAGNHLPIGSVFVLLLLALGVNTLLRRIREGLELSPGELLTVWLMVVVTSGIPSSGLCRYLFKDVTTPYYYASTENNWADSFHRFISSDLTPTTDGDNPVITAFFEGVPMPYGEDLAGLERWSHTLRNMPWEAWVRPLAFWSVMILAFYFVMMCLASIMRKQWVERERLQFPLMRLPLQMVDAPGPGQLLNSFFRSRVMWVGFAIAVVAVVSQSFNLFTGGAFPRIPPLIISLSKITGTVEPWKHMQLHYIQIMFSVIGICYLLTTEVSLSLWLFFLLYRASFMVGEAMGYSVELFPDWGRYMQAGSQLVWVGFMLWVARRHLGEVLRSALGRGSGEDTGEALSYRASLFGLIAGLLVLSAWSEVMGARFGIAFAYYLLICVMLVVLTRVVAEGGLLFVQQQSYPIATLSALLGPGFVGAASFVHFSIIQRIFAYDMREVMMPSLSNALKVFGPESGNRRKLFWAFAVAIVIALLVSYASLLLTSYNYGARFLALDDPRTMFDDITRTMERGMERTWKGPVNVGIGGAIMALLLVMRVRFVWWPLHPIGFFMAPTYPMHAIWSSVLIGWLCKYAILRVGGVQTYRKLLPFFLGLILGELVAGGAFIVLGMITGAGGYRVLPG